MISPEEARANARQHGYMEGLEGKSRKDNPYGRNYPLYREAWLEGWNDAKKEVGK